MLIVKIEGNPNGTHNNRMGRNLLISEGWIQIDESYQSLLPYISIVIKEDGTYTIQDNIEAREIAEKAKKAREEQKALLNEINNLKEQLSSTDYKAIKYAEGWLSAEEYALVKEERQTLREKINELEGKIN